MLATHWKEIATVLTRAPFLALFLIALPASALWSVDSSVTIRAATALVAAATLGIWFELRFDARTQIVLLSTLSALVVVLSIAFIVFLPEFGVEQSLHAGSWRGIFNHKNNLGRAMALAVTAFIIHMRWARGAFAYLVPGVVLAIGMLVGANSATAPFVLAAVLLLLAGDSLVRSKVLSRRLVGTVVALVGIGAIWLVASQFEYLLGLLGRDTSLSGRPLIWITLISKIAERPWLGYGVQAFWKGSQADYSAVDAVVGWSPGSGHNGFIDVAVDLGILGFALFLAGLFAALLGAYRLARDSASDETSIWPLAYLLLLSLSNLSESVLLRPNSIYWFLYAGIAARVALSTTRAKGPPALQDRAAAST